jgi:hypothetical protein
LCDLDREFDRDFDLEHEDFFFESAFLGDLDRLFLDCDGDLDLDLECDLDLFLILESEGDLDFDPNPLFIFSPQKSGDLDLLFECDLDLTVISVTVSRDNEGDSDFDPDLLSIFTSETGDLDLLLENNPILSGNPKLLLFSKYKQSGPLDIHFFTSGSLVDDGLGLLDGDFVNLKEKESSQLTRTVFSTIESSDSSLKSSLALSSDSCLSVPLSTFTIWITFVPSGFGRHGCSSRFE